MWMSLSSVETGNEAFLRPFQFSVSSPGSVPSLPSEVLLYHYRTAGSKIKYDTINKCSLITLVTNQVSQIALVKKSSITKTIVKMYSALMKRHLHTNMNRCIGLWFPLRDILTRTIETFSRNGWYIFIDGKEHSRVGTGSERWVLKNVHNLHTHTLLLRIVHIR